jgi:hypothetical protein
VSLRARLLLGLVVLTAAGLLIAGVVTYAAERSFLVSRVDQQLTGTTINSFEDYLDVQLGLTKAGGPGPGFGGFGLGAGNAGTAGLFPRRAAARAARGPAAACPASCSRRSAPTASTSPPTGR